MIEKDIDELRILIEKQTASLIEYRALLANVESRLTAAEAKINILESALNEKQKTAS